MNHDFTAVTELPGDEVSGEQVERLAHRYYRAREYCKGRVVLEVGCGVGQRLGYLSWEEYEQNQKRLQESAQAMGADRRHGPPREGPALRQGLVVCGRCGNRMTVRYHSRNGHLCPEYVEVRLLCATRLNHIGSQLYPVSPEDPE